MPKAPTLVTGIAAPVLGSSGTPSQPTLAASGTPLAPTTSAEGPTGSKSSAPGGTGTNPGLGGNIIVPGVCAGHGSVITFTAPNVRYVDVTIMPNGQVGILFATVTYGVFNLTPVYSVQETPNSIEFVPYLTENAFGPKVTLWSSSIGQTNGGLRSQIVRFGTKVIAMARRGSDGDMRVRTSTDNGATFSADASSGFALTRGDDFHFVVDNAGTLLYCFYVVPKPFGYIDVAYRTSSDGVTWSAEIPRGASSLGMTSHQGQSNGGGEAQFANSFAISQTKTGTWVLVRQNDSTYYNGDYIVETAATPDTAWTYRANLGHGNPGGALQYPNTQSNSNDGMGDLWRDSAGDLVMNFVSHEGSTFFSKHSTDSGLTWSADTTDYSLATGGAQYLTGMSAGLYVPAYTWTGGYIWCHERATGSLMVLKHGDGVQERFLLIGTAGGSTALPVCSGP